MKHDDFLAEILTEELPPNALRKLADAFCRQVAERVQKADLAFDEAIAYATPRRLAVLLKNLASAQPDQIIERKGPALSAAFDAQGKPTPACVGFARSCDVSPADLLTIKTSQGEWVGFRQPVKGKSAQEWLPMIVEQALVALPIPKRMRWGASEAEFVRPVHSLILLYGDQVINAMLFGCQAGRVTRGHRFHAPDWITIPHASTYASLLETEGRIIADFTKRRDCVRELAVRCIKKTAGGEAHVLMSDALLDEVAGLVEWPVALCGHFDPAFLRLPQEVLISSMQDHQRYFPVVDAKKNLLPHFVVISNIESHDPARVTHGNERVLRARLSDAAFFFETDKKERLEARLERLKGIVYQAKLGTLYDKAERLSKLSALIAKKLGEDEKHAARAGRLAKTDLTTQMVGEFPELQGIVGEYYARHDSEAEAVAQAMKEQYLPRFAGDDLPCHGVGRCLALADRLDLLAGYFGIHQIPTGDKDPYGLRRAALGVLRILIENQIDLDLKTILLAACEHYAGMFENGETAAQILNFIQERLRAYYQEKGITPDVFAAVAALSVTNPLDFDQRVKAVQAFKKMSEAESLSVANKRVSNILAKYNSAIDDKDLDETLFENESEKVLAQRLEEMRKTVGPSFTLRQYERVLAELAGLRKPVDDFFDHVMVMTDDKPRRENRIRLLSKLRALFLQVADIALLQ